MNLPNDQQFTGKDWIEEPLFPDEAGYTMIVEKKDWDIISAFKSRARKIWPYWIWVYLILVASCSGAIGGGIAYLWLYIINK